MRFGKQHASSLLGKPLHRLLPESWSAEFRGDPQEFDRLPGVFRATPLDAPQGRQEGT